MSPFLPLGCPLFCLLNNKKAWEQDFLQRFNKGWTLTSDQGDILSVSFSVDFIVLTPGGPDTTDDVFPPSHVDVTSDNGRSLYFLWKVNSGNVHRNWTWSHELGHQFGLKDEYNQPPYFWHPVPQDPGVSLMYTANDPAAEVFTRHIQEIVDHAALDDYLLMSGCKVTK